MGSNPIIICQNIQTPKNKQKKITQSSSKMLWTKVRGGRLVWCGIIITPTFFISVYADECLFKTVLNTMEWSCFDEGWKDWWRGWYNQIKIWEPNCYNTSWLIKNLITIWKIVKNHINYDKNQHQNANSNNNSMGKHRYIDDCRAYGTRDAAMCHITHECQLGAPDSTVFTFIIILLVFIYFHYRYYSF